MLKLGLTGGLASGKSFIASELERLGCLIIRADQLGHEALLSTGPAYAPTVDHFGSAILTGAGEIDRRALARIVFKSPTELAILNSFVHPAVFQREAELIAQAPPSSIVVIEAAILIESGSFRNMDRIALALCTPEQQMERALARPGSSREDVLARLSSQLPLPEKIPYAHYIIDTSGATAETIRQTRQLFDTLKEETRSCDSAHLPSP